MMRKLMVANWKENPSSEARALKLFREIAGAARGNAEVAVCPPFLYLEGIARTYRGLRSKKNLAFGAQDVFWKEKGAFTGTVGPKMLKSLGAKYVIIGHSERRKYFKENDATINKKIKLAIHDSLDVILCVGEPLAVRRKGLAAAQWFVANQLKKDLKDIKPRLIIAYEPLWAIGTGRSDKPADAAEMARFIKKDLLVRGSKLKTKVLYGGSANSKNIRDYVQYKEIDGALVGGASLKGKEFGKMIAIAARIKT